jgi:diaminopimelate decarboxylase
MAKNKTQVGFTLEDGYLYCDGICVKDIQNQVQISPLYLYSAQQLRHNYAQYTSALEGVRAVVSYALKANGNLPILKILQDLGSWATLVSGNELRLALAAGFEPGCMIFNGNGKTLDELALAVEKGVLINIDSEFDLEHIQDIADGLGKPADVLLRINPRIDPQVHPYVSTGLRYSKFGIPLEKIPLFLEQLKDIPSLHLMGVHCHLGSTIDKVKVFRQAMSSMATSFELARSQGFSVRYLNMGGGLGIDDRRDGGHPPSPSELVQSVRGLLPIDSTLILEPGRSLVGNAGVLVCRVIGVKDSGERRFIVIDGSMTELIRPSLYQAYHHIGYIEPVDGPSQVYDVVGPVCESADFLGVDRHLATPHEGTGVVVYDTGAYGYAMSSNYNARPRPPEFLVDGGQLLQIRRAENFEDHIRLFDVDEE